MTWLGFWGLGPGLGLAVGASHIALLYLGLGLGLGLGASHMVLLYIGLALAPEAGSCFNLALII